MRFFMPLRSFVPKLLTIPFCLVSMQLITIEQRPSVNENQTHTHTHKHIK